MPAYATAYLNGLRIVARVIESKSSVGANHSMRVLVPSTFCKRRHYNVIERLHKHKVKVAVLWTRRQPNNNATNRPKIQTAAKRCHERQANAPSRRSERRSRCVPKEQRTIGVRHNPRSRPMAQTWCSHLSAGLVRRICEIKKRGEPDAGLWPKSGNCHVEAGTNEEILMAFSLPLSCCRATHSAKSSASTAVKFPAGA